MEDDPEPEEEDFPEEDEDSEYDTEEYDTEDDQASDNGSLTGVEDYGHDTTSDFFYTDSNQSDADSVSNEAHTSDDESGTTNEPDSTDVEERHEDGDLVENLEINEEINEEFVDGNESDDQSDITGVDSVSSDILDVDLTPPEEEIVFESPKTTRSGRTVKPPEVYEPKFGGKSYHAFANILTCVLNNNTRQRDFRVGKDYIHHKAKKLFGDKYQQSAYKEFEQIHARGTIKPVDPSKLTKEQSEKVVRSILLTKMKESGECKSRTVADGSQQRGTVPDEEKASPTVSLLALFLTAVIDAKERHDVATLDIPNAFLHANLNED